MTDATKPPLTIFQCFPKREEPCDHKWSDDPPKDESGCVKCGTNFLTYIFMEMP